MPVKAIADMVDINDTRFWRIECDWCSSNYSFQVQYFLIEKKHLKMVCIGNLFVYRPR